MKILVAEDHAESRYLLQQLFSGLGHEVSAVADGLEALEQLERGKGPAFDVIVSDALMPRLDGFRLCREIRRHPRWCGLPFIFYTATYTERGDEQMAMNLGADRFVLKPEEPARLMELIEETVARVKAAPPRVPLPLDAGSEMEEYTQRLSLKLERKVAELEGLNDDLRRSDRAVRELNERLTATVTALENEARERRDAERRLRFREHLLSQAERIGQVGSWERLGESDELLVSDEACRIFGVPPGAALTMDWIRGHVHEADRERVLQAWGEADDSAEYFECEYRLVRNDGTECPVAMKRRVFCDESGTVRYVGVLQDLTERRQTEAQRARLETQLRQAQKMEAIGNLAGGIAHDFNNILTAIMAHAELLDLELSRTGMPAQLRDSVSEILTASSRAQEMVRQILTFSRKQPVERKPVQIDGVVADALRLVRVLLPAAVGLRDELHAHRVVLANEAQIHQVVMNLCTNAAHAVTDGDGAIMVTLGVADLTDAGAAVRPPLKAGEYVLLEVRDNGCGMEPATAERIFEPFFTTKNVGDGTGLGLAVVHGIVQAHDGAIFVESMPGRGTIFSIYLPALSLEDTRPGVTPALPTGAGEKILFVDDEPSVARIGARLLERLGYVVESMTDPVEAKARLVREPRAFDLVVTDYLMPRMTGLDLARAVKTVHPDMPMILAIGFGGQLDATTAREQGFCEFVTKPFALQTLAEAVRRALGRT